MQSQNGNNIDILTKSLPSVSKQFTNNFQLERAERLVTSSGPPVLRYGLCYQLTGTMSQILLFLYYYHY